MPPRKVCLGGRRGASKKNARRRELHRRASQYLRLGTQEAKVRTTAFIPDLAWAVAIAAAASGEAFHTL